MTQRGLGRRIREPMTEHDKIFDRDLLDRRFREATALPNTAPDDKDWWTLWHRHLAGRKSPVWFYSYETADKFATQWPALTLRWRAVAEELLQDIQNGGFRPARLANGDIDWGANPAKSMNWAGFHYFSNWTNPLIRGYGLTGDERFVTEFSNHLRSYFEQVDTFIPELWTGATFDQRSPEEWRDWITHNDLSSGLKMMAFSEAIMVFARSSAWSSEDLRHASLLMIWLAERLSANYRDVSHPADFLRTKNWLTAGAAGLGAVAAVFPECQWSKSWFDLAIRILETHVMDLYYSDGGQGIVYPIPQDRSA
jgi:hypothetical protein